MDTNNPWTVTKEHHQHMLARQNQLRAKGMSPAEYWFHSAIAPRTKYKWTYQARWGFRMFDFWNSKLGLAVEIDGPEHSKEVDQTKDLKEWERSRIVTFRIKNMSDDDASQFLAYLDTAETWNERREKAGLKRIKSSP